MPIKDPDLYPPDWWRISLQERVNSGWRCRFCRAEQGEPHPVTGSRVVLTVAHLDHNPQNNDPDNLAALCQKCHLAYDQQEHLHHAAQTRRRRKVEAGQLELLEAP